MDQSSIEIFSILLLVMIFLIAALPLKNYLEIRNVEKKEHFWLQWTKELPSKETLIQQNVFSEEQVQCKFCESTRQYSSLEMVIPNKPRFGWINNSFNKYAHFKAYICSGCGTQLYRERYEE